MISNRRFKHKKTATTNRVKEGEVLKVDLKNVKITLQNQVTLIKDLALRLKERFLVK